MGRQQASMVWAFKALSGVALCLLMTAQAQAGFTAPPAELSISLDQATITRTYEWNITKSADTSELTLATGAQAEVNYVVDVEAAIVESFLITGSMFINNVTPNMEYPP